MGRSGQAFGLLATVRGRILDALEAACARDWQAWQLACDDLEPVLRGTFIYETIAALQSREPLRIEDGVYADWPIDAATLLQARNRVAEHLGLPFPVVIVCRRLAGFAAQQHGELDGIAVLDVADCELSDIGTLAHELTHACIRCGHRFLDEGLAEWIGVLCAEGSSAAARTSLIPLAERAPPIELLAASRWSDEPFFESLNLPPRVPHARAALFVADHIERSGLSDLLAWMEEVRVAATGDLRTCSRWPRPEREEPPPDPALVSRVRLAFWLDDPGSIQDDLATIHEQALLCPPHGEWAELAARASLILSWRDMSRLFNQSTDRFVVPFIEANHTSPLAFALSIALAAQDAQFSPSISGRHASAETARRLCEAATDAFPDDVDVLVAAGKFWRSLPEAYGGSPRLAGTYLMRAAARVQLEAAAQAFQAAARSLMNLQSVA